MKVSELITHPQSIFETYGDIDAGIEKDMDCGDDERPIGYFESLSDIYVISRPGEKPVIQVS